MLRSEKIMDMACEIFSRMSVEEKDAVSNLKGATQYAINEATLIYDTCIEIECRGV